MADSADRQHAPTAHRRQKAKEEGQTWHSADVGVAAGMIATVAGLAWWVPWMVHQWQGLWVAVGSYAIRATAWGALGRLVIGTLFRMVLPFGGGLMLWSLLIQAATHGFALPWQWPKKPWNPLAAMARLVSKTTWTQLLFAIGKLLVVGGMVGLGVWALRPWGAAWVWLPPAAWSRQWWALWQPVFWRVAGGFAVIAGLDAFWQYRQWMNRLKMTTQEMRDERKDLEGDPRVRQRRRALGRQLLRRPLSQISEAAVVVANPTHIAVALSWSWGQSTPPTIWGKGADDTAVAIREAAHAAGVPVVEDPPLAWALWPVPVDASIPETQWRAVAALLGFLWRHQRRPAQDSS